MTHVNLAGAVIERIIEDEQYPDISYLEQEGFESRLAEYLRGDFHFISVRACLKVNLSGTLVTYMSPGLWGIESDSSDEYLDEVFKDEISFLVANLEVQKEMLTNLLNALPAATP